MIENNRIFPLGERASEYFKGEVYINKQLIEDNLLGIPIWNVVFTPSSCTYWHVHKIGQVLLVLDGVGWYQEEGKDMQVIRKGDIVSIPSGIKHWHGANKENSLTHLALTLGETVWLEEVENNGIN